jgi:uncharacterized membrane protein YkvA (DUF1232 family)/DNA-binding Xre family transcriptional regulator
MTDESLQNNVGLLLKKFLKEQSLTMRKLSELTGIDTATISRIINGKRKANPGHLKKFADCLGVPIGDLFAAAGFPIEQNEGFSDIHISVDRIKLILDTSNIYDKKYTIADVEKQLKDYQQYAETEEGREYILKNFDNKLGKAGSIGPFIDQLKDMYERFRTRRGTALQLALIGSALLYFIIPIDIIPDYLFPFGYIDDAIAIQIVASLLK